MVRHLLRVPAIDGIAVGLRYSELVGCVIGIKMPPLRAERASAARKLFGQFAVDLERGSSAMAVSGEGHYSLLIMGKALSLRHSKPRTEIRCAGIVSSGLRLEHCQLRFKRAPVRGSRHAAGDIGGKCGIFLDNACSVQSAQHHQQIASAELTIEPIAIAKPVGDVA